MSAPENSETPGSEPADFRSSTPGSTGPDGASGEMGVSSERIGHTGPGQVGTDGLRDTSPHEREPDEEILPEQAAGGPEVNPADLQG